MTVKQRVEIGDTVTSQDGFYAYGAPYLENPLRSARLVSSAQRIVSDGHPYRRLGKDGGDIGGAFLNQKCTFSAPADELYLSESRGNLIARWVRGIPFASPAIHDRYVDSFDMSKVLARCPTPASALELNGKGATAIARCRPANPLVDGATFLGELVDGLPAVPGTQRGNVGGEYLNLEFGLAPAVSDIQKFRDSALHADKYLAQLERDSGKSVRRGFDYEPTSESSTTYQPGQYLIFAGGTTGDVRCQTSGVLTTTETYSKRVWFKGAFTYHLPPKGEWRRDVAELDYLYGIKPGVDTAWNLIPFSWLVDWRLNIGDVLSNINAFAADGLTMRYGYVMCEQKRSYTYTLENTVNEFGSWRDLKTTNTVTYTTQQRSPATPFGFGVDMGGISARQIAILAALGISRK